MEVKFNVNPNNNSKCIQFTDISGDINYKFDCSKKVYLIRIIGTRDGFYNRYNKIKIGNKEFTKADGVKGFMNPSSAYEYACQDYSFEAEFEKGDNFIVQHDNCIKILILFLK